MRNLTNTACETLYEKLYETLLRISTVCLYVPYRNRFSSSFRYTLFPKLRKQKIILFFKQKYVIDNKIWLSIIDWKC